MEISARSGRVSVIASAQLTTFEGHPLEITVEVGPSQTFSIKWSFVSDPETLDVDVVLEREGDLVHLICSNFDHSDGRGTSKPLHLGDVGTQRFWLHFKVFLFGKTLDRTVQYTMYVETL